MGTWRWLVPLYGDALRGAVRLATDSADNLWLTGAMERGMLSFGSYGVQNTHVSSGIRPLMSGFVARLDANQQWRGAGLYYGLYSADNGGSMHATPLLLVAERHGSAYLCGEMGDAVQWRFFTNTAAPQPDTTLQVADALSHNMVVRVDSTGQVQGYQLAQAAAGAALKITDAAPGPQHSLYLTGHYYNQVGFGPYALPSQRLYNGFLAYLTSVGVGLPEDVASPERGIDLWPNPATTTAHLRLPTPTAPGQGVRLYDVLGRVVRHWPLAGGTITVDLPLTGVPPGVYIVRCGRTAQTLVVNQ